jgi:hypothetical protein
MMYRMSSMHLLRSSEHLSLRPPQPCSTNDMSAEKLRLAATLIEQSPPGQVGDVLRGGSSILGQCCHC